GHSTCCPHWTTDQPRHPNPALCAGRRSWLNHPVRRSRLPALLPALPTLFFEGDLLLLALQEFVNAAGEVGHRTRGGHHSRAPLFRREGRHHLPGRALWLRLRLSLPQPPDLCNQVQYVIPCPVLGA